jgi:hypothetical protein
MQPVGWLQDAPAVWCNPAHLALTKVLKQTPFPRSAPLWVRPLLLLLLLLRLLLLLLLGLLDSQLWQLAAASQKGLQAPPRCTALVS